MNEQHPLQSFIDLVTFDQELVTLETEVKKLEHEVADAKGKFFQIEQSLEQAKQRVYDARKEVDHKELEMKELEAQRSATKERLENVKNAKEYQAVKSEAEKLKTQQSQLDEVLLGVWQKFEAAQKEQEVLAHDAEKKLAEQKDIQEKKQEKILEIKKVLEERSRARAEREKRVPADWLERYAMMRSRVTDPVVPILQNSCSACFWSVSNQDMLTLKRGALLQCKGCYRFLYIPKESAEQEKQV